MPCLILRRAKGSPALNASRVRMLAERMLETLELSGAELSVLLTNDAQIHALNREHRGKDRPTDVLAFPIDEAPGMAQRHAPRILGDVVISLDTAERQARSRKRELLSEVRFLLAHGILHLIGYDHATRAEKREMDAMTRKLVRAATDPAAIPAKKLSVRSSARKAGGKRTPTPQNRISKGARRSVRAARARVSK